MNPKIEHLVMEIINKNTELVHMIVEQINPLALQILEEANKCEIKEKEEEEKELKPENNQEFILNYIQHYPLKSIKNLFKKVKPETLDLIDVNLLKHAIENRENRENAYHDKEKDDVKLEICDLIIQKHPKFKDQLKHLKVKFYD